MRILALDYGSARTGCAVSDPSGTLVTPLDVIEPSEPAAAARLAAELEAELIVVGLPLSLRGDLGPAAKAALSEARQLATVVEVPVETFDERFTTVTAQRALHEAKVRGRAVRQVVDKVAAAVMLQAFLDRRAGGDR